MYSLYSPQINVHEYPEGEANGAGADTNDLQHALASMDGCLASSNSTTPRPQSSSDDDSISNDTIGKLASNYADRFANDYSFLDDVQNVVNIPTSRFVVNENQMVSNENDITHNYIAMSTVVPMTGVNIQLPPPVPPRVAQPSQPPLPVRSKSAHMLAMRLLDGPDRRSLSPKSGSFIHSSTDRNPRAAYENDRKSLYTSTSEKFKSNVMLQNRSFSDPHFRSPEKVTAYTTVAPFGSRDQSILSRDGNPTWYSSDQIGKVASNFEGDLSYLDGTYDVNSVPNIMIDSQDTEINDNNLLPPNVPDRTDSLELIHEQNGSNSYHETINSDKIDNSGTLVKNPIPDIESNSNASTVFIPITTDGDEIQLVYNDSMKIEASSDLTSVESTPKSPPILSRTELETTNDELNSETNQHVGDKPNISVSRIPPVPLPRNMYSSNIKRLDTGPLVSDNTDGVTGQSEVWWVSVRFEHRRIYPLQSHPWIYNVYHRVTKCGVVRRYVLLIHFTF